MAASPGAEVFQKTFTQETFKKTLLMNRTETSWRWMHSGDSRGNEFPSPGSSEYHLPLARRPKSAGVSHFTARENLRLHSHAGLCLPASPKKSSAAHELPSPPKTPTDQDFQRVIDRLCKLQAVNYGRRIVLTEDKAESCVLDPSEVQYFKVMLAGKPTPLKVMLKRTKGKAVTYVSTAISEPSEVVNDAVYRKDLFTVTEMGAQFRLEAVFFAVQAIGTLAFSVNVHFGKRKITRSDSSPRSRLVQAKEEEQWERYRSKQEAKMPSPSKSFIRRNLVIVPTSSPKRIQEAESRRKAMEQRRKSAFIRRKSIEADRKKRTFFTLHKQEIKQQELQQTQLAAAQALRKRSCQKDWLRLMANAAFVEEAWGRFETRKSDLGIQAKQRKAAVKIQARFRCFLKGADVPGIALRHCRNALFICFRHTSPAFVQRSRSKLVRFLAISLQNSVIFAAASRMLRRSKCHLVTLVQRKWRKWVQRRQDMLEEMASGWTAVLETVMREAVKAGRNAKKWRKRKDLTPAYLHISAELKRQLLEEHLNKAKDTYKERLREYLRTQEELKRGGKRAFAEAWTREGALRPAPVLEYLPEKDQMRAYIDKAARLTLKSLKQ